MSNCSKCTYWGDGDGTGYHYDAGNVNQCKHPQIDGQQAPSVGACGEPTSMVMAGGETQLIMTRWSFACILFQPFTNPKEK